MKKIIRIVAVVLCSTIAFACDDVGALSDSNSIKSFSLSSYAPNEIEMGNIELSDNLITIPIVYGEEKFPLTFNVDVAYDGKIDCVVGADLSKSLTLESADDQIEFIVMAQSGMPRRYTIKTDVKRYNAVSQWGVEIDDVTPESVLLAEKVFLNDNVLSIPVVNPSFPLTFTPHFVFDEKKIGLENFANGATSLRFDDIDSSVTIRSIDYITGAKRDLEIKLHAVDISETGSQAVENTISTSNIDMEIGDSGTEFYNGRRIDNTTNNIVLFFQSTVGFPVKASFSINKTEEQIAVLGNKALNDVTFDSWDDKKEFYIYNVHENKAYRWAISLSKILQSAAEVEAFDFTCSSNGGVKLSDNAVVDPSNGTVTLTVTDNGNGKFSIAPRPTLSAGASSDLGSNLSWQSFSEWDTPKEFTVTAEDGTEKSWKIIVSHGQISSAAEVTAFDFTYSATDGAVLESETLIDSSKGLITLTATKKGTVGAIAVTPRATFSPKATSDLTTLTWQSSSTWSTPKTFTVTAEDGTQKQWKVIIQYIEVSSLAEVVKFDFTYTSLTGVVLSPSAAIDSSKGEITLTVTNNGTGNGAFFVVPTLTLSPKATSDIGTLTWTSSTEWNNSKTFTVTAEDGSRKQWKVLISYRQPSSEANVVGFGFTYSSTSNVKLNGTAAIDSANNRITLTVTDNGTGTGDLTVVPSVTLSEYATSDFATIRWNSSDEWNTTKTFTVTAENGAKKTWNVKLNYTETVLSQECELLSVSLKSLLPYDAQANSTTPITIDRDAKTITINLIEDDDFYPVSAVLNCTASDKATVSGTSMSFASLTATNTLTVTAEDGIHSQAWTVKLTAPEQDLNQAVSGFTVTSVSTSGFTSTGATVDTDNAKILISLSASGSCPLTLDYSLSLVKNVTSSLSTSGSLTFASLNEQKTFTLTSRTGKTKTWTIAFADYVPQLSNWNLDTWTDKNTPSSWATANNSFVKGTSQGTGVSGSAATMNTTIVMTKLASGSLFLGRFDGSNPLTALSDPVKLTFQGIPFSASKKIVGMQLDVKYSAGGGSSTPDTGSLVVELVKQNASASSYVYHGDSAGKTTPHPDNTATRVARGKMLVGNTAANGVNVLAKDTWTTVTVPIDYTSVSNAFDYTHLVVIFGCSSQGDSFIGEKGTKMTVDNVKIIYE